MKAPYEKADPGKIIALVAIGAVFTSGLFLTMAFTGIFNESSNGLPDPVVPAKTTDFTISTF